MKDNVELYRFLKKDKLEHHVKTYIEGSTHACGKIHKTRGAVKRRI